MAEEPFTDHEEAKNALHSVQNVLYPTIAVIGIAANLLVIVVLKTWEKSRANRNVSQIFAVNLAIADLLFLFTLPLYMPVWLRARGWPYGSFMCGLLHAVNHINYHASILFLATMSIDRLLATVYAIETRVHRTRRNAVVVCALSWLLSVAVAAPVFTFARVDTFRGFGQCVVVFPGTGDGNFADETEINNFINSTTNFTSDFDYDDIYSDIIENYGDVMDDPVAAESTLGQNGTDAVYAGISGENTEPLPKRCVDTSNSHSDSYLMYEYFNFVVFFIVPVLAIVTSYVLILRTTAKRMRRRNDVTGTGAHYQGNTCHQAAFTVAVLVSAFLLCWSPYQIWRMLILPPGYEVNRRNDCAMVDAIFLILAWSNSAINPLLYSLVRKRFRHKMKAALLYACNRKKTNLTVRRSSQRSTQQKTALSRLGSAPSNHEPTTPDYRKQAPEHSALINSHF